MLCDSNEMCDCQEPSVLSEIWQFSYSWAEMRVLIVLWHTHTQRDTRTHK